MVHDPGPEAADAQSARLRPPAHHLGLGGDRGADGGQPLPHPGGRQSKRVHKIKPATLGELEVIVAELPDRYGLMVLLASWCALRFGELIELRRYDIDVKAGKIMVRRAVTVVNGEAIVGDRSRMPASVTWRSRRTFCPSSAST